MDHFVKRKCVAMFEDLERDSQSQLWFRYYYPRAEELFGLQIVYFDHLRCGERD